MSKVNLLIDQGTTFQAVVDLRADNGDPLNIQGYIFRGQMRKHYQSVNKIDFGIAADTGVLILFLTAQETANLAAGRYVYDVEMVDTSNQVIRLLNGIVTVTPEVTK